VGTTNSNAQRAIPAMSQRNERVMGKSRKELKKLRERAKLRAIAE
jgi:hypothetical protein